MWIGRAIFGLVLLVCTGCVTPSIPIPPPEPSLMTFDITVDGASSTATFAYPAKADYGGAIVYVFNRDQGLGIIEQARPDGSVGPTRPVSARENEQIVISFQLDDQSVSRCIRLRQGPQDPNNHCGP
ncbi:MAG TPA: hypothetical protein VK427_00855 [Kofleriaceae bacterium]|nr:hypothetical protein [Kofleriaceae bacterium]